MGSWGCWLIWLLVGVLLAWLFNYWFRKRGENKTKENVAPVAKATDTPVTTIAPAKKAQAKPKTVKAKPKTATKAKATPAKTATTKAAPAKSTTVKATTVKATIDLAAAKAAGIPIKNADDLTIIEGVGPKINDLFKDNGLNTFAQVGNATVTQMRAILDKGGARYRMANPSTWAKQAKLANNNKWVELKKLQDELSAGKKKE